MHRTWAEQWCIHCPVCQQSWTARAVLGFSGSSLAGKHSFIIRKLGDGNICFVSKEGDNFWLEFQANVDKCGSIIMFFSQFLGYPAQSHEHIAIGSCSHFWHRWEGIGNHRCGWLPCWVWFSRATWEEGTGSFLQLSCGLAFVQRIVWPQPHQATESLGPNYLEGTIWWGKTWTFPGFNLVTEAASCSGTGTIAGENGADSLSFRRCRFRRECTGSKNSGRSTGKVSHLFSSRFVNFR